MKVLAIVLLFALVALAYSVPWGGLGYGYKIALPSYRVAHYGYAPAYGGWGYGGYGGYGASVYRGYGRGLGLHGGYGGKGWW